MTPRKQNGEDVDGRILNNMSWGMTPLRQKTSVPHQGFSRSWKPHSLSFFQESAPLRYQMLRIFPLFFPHFALKVHTLYNQEFTHSALKVHALYHQKTRRSSGRKQG